MTHGHRDLPPFQLGLWSESASTVAVPQEKNGAVYTKSWIVELILDLAGYTPEHDLAATVAVEPAVGEGAFLAAMVRRLVASCRRYARPIHDAASALIAYELDPTSAVRARKVATETLVELGVPTSDAKALSTRWVIIGDYLIDAPTLPRADFVIGNPPYIRLEDLDAGLMADYRALYRTMIGRADIYVAFFEAALRQLRPEGVCAYICADRWMLNQYGSALRQLVTSNFAVETIIELHNANAFLDDVSAYPAITVIRRRTQGSVVVARATHEAEEYVSELATQLLALRTAAGMVALPGARATRVDFWFRDDNPWPCFNPARLSLLAYLEAEFDP